MCFDLKRIKNYQPYPMTREVWAIFTQNQSTRCVLSYCGFRMSSSGHRRPGRRSATQSPNPRRTRRCAPRPERCEGQDVDEVVDEANSDEGVGEHSQLGAVSDGDKSQDYGGAEGREGLPGVHVGVPGTCSGLLAKGLLLPVFAEPTSAMVCLHIIVLSGQHNGQNTLQKLGDEDVRKHGDHRALRGEQKRHLVQVRVNKIVHGGDHFDAGYLKRKAIKVSDGLLSAARCRLQKFKPLLSICTPRKNNRRIGTPFN
jgi:hypothetical protein